MRHLSVGFLVAALVVACLLQCVAALPALRTTARPGQTAQRSGPRPTARRCGAASCLHAAERLRGGDGEEGLDQPGEHHQEHEGAEGAVGENMGSMPGEPGTGDSQQADAAEQTGAGIYSSAFRIVTGSRQKVRAGRAGAASGEASMGPRRGPSRTDGRWTAGAGRGCRHRAGALIRARHFARALLGGTARGRERPGRPRADPDGVPRRRGARYGATAPPHHHHHSY